MANKIFTNEVIEAMPIPVSQVFGNEEIVDQSFPDQVSLDSVSEGIEYMKILKSGVLEKNIANFQISPEKISLNKSYVRPMFESFDMWESDGDGSVIERLGGFTMYSGEGENFSHILSASGDAVGMDFVNKNPKYEAYIYISSSKINNVIIYFGSGNYLTVFIGFKVHNGKLYACLVSDETEYRVEITSADFTTRHYYRVILDSDVDCKFYIDDVFVASISDGIPMVYLILSGLFEFYIKTLDGENKFITCMGVSYIQDK